MFEDKFIEKNDGIILRIRISPNASKNQILIDGDIIKVKVTAQPIENKANKAVIEFLSKLFKIPKTSISIIKGETSKDKTLFLSIIEKEKIEFIKNILFN